MALVNKRNQHAGTFNFSSKQGVKCQGGGGARYGVNNSTLSQSSNSGMGRGYPISTTSNACGGKTNPSNLGAATIRGGGKPYSSFNNLRSSAYGYTSAGASMANTFKGSYAAPSEIRRAQCGGRRKTKRRRKRGGIQAGITGKIKKSAGMPCKKSFVGSECTTGNICTRNSKTPGKYGTCQPGKSIAGKWGLGGRKSRRRKSRGRKSRGRKSRGRKSRGRKSRGRKSRRRRKCCKCKRKCGKKCPCKRRSKCMKSCNCRKRRTRKRQRGGNKWSQAGSNQALGYRYSSPNFNEPMPWALGGPGSKVVTPLTR